jgi:DNA-binding transcriptional MerR regulator
MAHYRAIRAMEPAALDNAVTGKRTDRPQSGGIEPIGNALTIGEVAREFGVTLRALRFYEAKRLIRPQRHGATRLYSRDDRERLRLILTGRRLGFALAEIREFMGRPDGSGLHLTRAQCVAQINMLEQQRRGIEIALAELRQIYSSFYRRNLDGAA